MRRRTGNDCTDSTVDQEFWLNWLKRQDLVTSQPDFQLFQVLSFITDSLWPLHCGLLSSYERRYARAETSRNSAWHVRILLLSILKNEPVVLEVWVVPQVASRRANP